MFLNVMGESAARKCYDWCSTESGVKSSVGRISSESVFGDIPLSCEDSSSRILMWHCNIERWYEFFL